MLGAVIGAVVGLVMAMVMLAQRKGSHAQRLKALTEQGPAAARLLLDRKIPATRDVALNKILDQRERMVRGSTSAFG